MHIPFPERVPINRAVLFAVVLFAIQKLEGTPLYFCAGCMIFIVVAAFAFNAAGGLTRASGAYVFFYSILVVIVGLCYKAYLGEPGQSNLVDPRTDIEAYVGSIVAMYGAVIVSRRLSRKSGLLRNVLKESDMYRASIGCMLFGVLGGLGIALLGESAQQLKTAFAQLNLLMPVGILIGIMYEIRRSGGTRCTNLFVTLATMYGFFLGATGFSKQGMILPLFLWLLPICALRYRLSMVQAFSAFLAVFIVFYYLVPFSQYGRGQITEESTLTQRTNVVVMLLEHPNETRRAYYESQEEVRYQSTSGVDSYYNTSQGFWERLQFIAPDDHLNNFTDQGHKFGLMPIKLAFLNIIPHFLWPDKPGANLGNIYTHEINGEAQGEGDTTTGISFSPTGEAYHLEGWVGIFVLAPILWCIAFSVLDSLLGDVRDTPWGLLAIAIISHIAPEGGITGAVYLFSFCAEVLLFCSFFAAWLAPILAAALLGPQRRSAELVTQPRHLFSHRVDS